jgi:hypothetical protein
VILPNQVIQSSTVAKSKLFLLPPSYARIT